MTTALYTHTICLQHHNGLSHPESPQRLKAIFNELEHPDYAALLHKEAPLAQVEHIARVHDGAYIDDIFDQMPIAGYTQLDPDTALSPNSGEAALRAAGAVIAAVDDVMNGQIKNAFCAVRPPGHHALPTNAMGFCLFNNVAIGAAHVLCAHKLSRVAIVDFDVHHGNGTEAWASSETSVRFYSTHQHPLWPGSGRKSDQGPLGNIVNVPLPPDTDGRGFRAAFTTFIRADLEAFAPEFIFISAGFDAHRDDPLAGLCLEAEDFGWVTSELCASAARSAKGRVVSTLEGGYNLKALAESAGAHIRSLMQA